MVESCVAKKEGGGERKFEYSIEKETCEPLGDGHISHDDLNEEMGNGLDKVQRKKRQERRIVRAAQFGIVGALYSGPIILLHHILDSTGYQAETFEAIALTCGYAITVVSTNAVVNSMNKFIEYKPNELQQMRDLKRLKDVFDHQVWREQPDGSQAVCNFDFENFKQYIESLTRGDN